MRDKQRSVDYARIEAQIFKLLESRDELSSICPSDVARSLGSADDWRQLMDPVRSVAARLVEQGRVRVTQGHDDVDIQTVKGPIRIRRPLS